MRQSEGRALGTLLGICEALMRRVESDEARSYVDGLSDAQMADVFDAHSAASAARGNGPDFFAESAAARFRGVDVEQYGSGELAPDDAADVADQVADKILKNAGLRVERKQFARSRKQPRRSAR